MSETAPTATRTRSPRRRPPSYVAKRQGDEITIVSSAFKETSDATAEALSQAQSEPGAQFCVVQIVRQIEPTVIVPRPRSAFKATLPTA